MRYVDPTRNLLQVDETAGSTFIPGGGWCLYNASNRIMAEGFFVCTKMLLTVKDPYFFGINVGITGYSSLDGWLCFMVQLIQFFNKKHEAEYFYSYTENISRQGSTKTM